MRRSLPSGRTSSRWASLLTSRAVPRRRRRRARSVAAGRGFAPFAASFGDRFRRERFLLAMTLLGPVALAASAAAAFAATGSSFLRSPPSSGSVHVDPAGAAGAAAIARADAGGADRVEWRDLDDRERRHAHRTVGCRRARVVADVGRRLRSRWRQRFSSAPPSSRASGSRARSAHQRAEGESLGRIARRRLSDVARTPRARLVVALIVAQTLRPGLPQRPDRRRGLPRPSTEARPTSAT